MLNSLRTIQKAAITWPFIVIASIAFLYGPRYAYLVFNFAGMGPGVIFCISVGGRYLGVERESHTSHNNHLYNRFIRA
jgi:hypothetical protein